ncbi:MAG: glycosyltransferase family A protein, partial [Pseudomonas sp.]
AEDLELLVVDDGSQDGTADVLHRYIRTYGTRIQVIQQANAGAGAARNRGIRQARGRYVLLLDADDELLPQAFTVLRRALGAKPEAAMVLGGQISVSPSGEQRVHRPTAVQGSARVRCQRYLLDKSIAISHSRTLFRRDLLLQRPYPEHLRSGEDIAVFAYVLTSGEVLTTPQPVARLYKHGDSLRHCRVDEEAVALGMLHEVFAQLPVSCQSLRQRYGAQRYLSLFRTAWRAGEWASARRFYTQALRLSVWQALRPAYLGKALRMVLR